MSGGASLPAPGEGLVSSAVPELPARPCSSSRTGGEEGSRLSELGPDPGPSEEQHRAGSSRSASPSTLFVAQCLLHLYFFIKFFFF